MRASARRVERDEALRAEPRERLAGSIQGEPKLGVVGEIEGVVR